MDNRVRVGVVGTGVMGRMHLKHLSAYEGASIYAIAEVAEEPRRKAAEEFAPEHLYERGEELIADHNVDAVVLALPAQHRAELGVAALRAGRHLFLEKPVARSVAEVDALRSAKRPEQTVAVASSRFTFLPSFAAVRQAIRDAGGPSSVYQISHAGIRANPPLPDTVPPNWRLSFERNGGGIMSNWGCYDLNYLLALMEWEARVVEVTATWRPVPAELHRWVADGSDAETHVSAYLRLSTGAVILLDRGEYLPVPESFNATTILGDTYSLSCAIMADTVPYTQSRYAESGTTTSVIWEEKDDWVYLNRPVICDFVDAIRTGREPATDLEKARHIQAITDAVYESAREQRSIQL
jgi:predicted dehydrogenase